MTAPDILNILREAGTKSGIDRETLFLYALKLVFDSHAATENDWKAASRESQERWRRQITAVLNHLEFCTAGAEAYAGEPENQSLTAQMLSQRLAEHRASAEALRIQKTGLESQLTDAEAGCARLQHDCWEIQRHIEALKTESDRYRREMDQRKQVMDTLAAEKSHQMQLLSNLKNDEQILSTEIRKLNEDGAERQKQLSDLKGEIIGLRDQIGRQDSSVQQLTDEFNLLQELQRVLAEHHQLVNILGIEQVHALANSDLINRMRQQHDRLRGLQRQIDADLKETDRLLADEIGLNQKQWNDVRQLRH